MFAEASLLEKLHSKLRTLEREGPDDISPTGIPPFVGNRKMIKDLKLLVKTLRVEH